MIHSVAIQGVKGSFHHIVSQHFFNGSTEVLECLSFDKAVDSLISERTDAAIMAIENSIAGSIIPNYALIDNHDLHIVGEHYLDICKHSTTSIYESKPYFEYLVILLYAPYC